MSSGDRQTREEQNRLLRAMPLEEYERLHRYLEPVERSFKLPLYRKDQPIEHVYFVRVGVVSMVSRLEDGMIVEVATIGKEGMVGLPADLGADTFSLETFVQIPGEGLQLPTPVLREQVENGGALSRLLQRYTQALFVQIAQRYAPVFTDARLTMTGNYRRESQSPTGLKMMLVRPQRVRSAPAPFAEKL